MATACPSPCSCRMGDGTSEGVGQMEVRGTRMILTFARLQRVSKLVRPSAIRKWLIRQGVAHIKDGDGNPITTLDAFNRRLQNGRTKNQLIHEPTYAADDADSQRRKK